MQTVTTIGLDIAKSVFQVHAVDAAGKVIIRRQLKRGYVLAFFEKLPPCLTKRKPVPRHTIGHAMLQALKVVRKRPPRSSVQEPLPSRRQHCELPAGRERTRRALM